MSICKKTLFTMIFFVLSCSSSPMKTYRIGMDPSLPSLQFPQMLPYVTGFLKDYLMRISKDYDIALIQINGDRLYLLRGLDQDKYDGALSSTPPFNFYEDKYIFSDVIIPIGPILVTRRDREVSSLKDMKNKIIAVQQSDLPKLDLSSYPQITIQIYSSNLEALNDLIRQKVDGALIRYIPAVSYVEDTFYERLKIVGSPLNDQGLRLISLKENERLISAFNKTLAKMKKESNFEKLLMKWDIKISSK